MKKIFSSRLLRQGGVATAITVVAVVLVVLLNMVVSALDDRFGLSLDMTSDQILTLSEETKDFLKSVDKPVNITALTDYDSFAAPNAYYRQAAEMMNNFGQQNTNINVVFMDVLKNPAFTAQYPELTLSSSSILVESEGRTQVLTMNDFFNTQTDYETYQTYITSSRVEQALASAILNVTEENPVKILVLEGHNEVDVSNFTSLLQMNGFVFETRNLMTDDLDEDASMAILAAPARDLTQEESQKLDAFLNNDNMLGKSLIYLASADQPEDMPILAAFLADWGIAVEPGIVFETDQRQWFNISPTMTLVSYAEEEYSADVQAKQLPFALPNSRPLKALFETKSSTSVATLVAFSTNSGIMPIDAPSNFYSTDAFAAGGVAHPGILLATQQRYDQLTPLNSYVLAIGSNLAVDPALTSSYNYANSEYFINLLSKMAGREQTFSVQSKTIARTQLGINAGQAYTLGIALVIVLPLLTLALGIFIWVRRRHR